jgi:hypothetical protein
MNCGNFDRLIGPFVDGDLPPAQVRIMEAHLDSCPQCREQLREWRALSTTARQLPRFSAPAGFESELMRRIQAREHRRWRYLLFDLPRPAVQALAYASLVFALGISALLLRQAAFRSGPMEAEYRSPEPPAAVSNPIAGPVRRAGDDGQFMEASSRTEPDMFALPPIRMRYGFSNYAIPQNTDYVDYLVKGTGDQEVYIRLPRTIIFYPPADNDAYYVRNISH